MTAIRLKLSFGCLLLSTFLFGQNEIDISFFEGLNTEDENRVLRSDINEDDGVFDQTAKFFYNNYKRYISSQDGNRCSFHPSCSTYFIQSVQLNGIVLGSIQAFDRLMRCNGLSPEKYEIDLERKTFIDHAH